MKAIIAVLGLSAVAASAALADDSGTNTAVLADPPADTATATTAATPPPPSPAAAPSAPSASAAPTGQVPLMLAPMPPPPPDLPAPVQEVVRLAQMTFGEAVVLDYIATIKTPYHLNADQVVYLSDLGISSRIVQAVLQHSIGADAPRTPSLPPGLAPAPDALATAPLPPPAPAEDAAVEPPGAPPAGWTPGNTPPPAGAPYDASLTVASAPAAGMAPPPVPQDPGAYEAFAPSLAPYGAWDDVPGYGMAWQPTAAAIDPGWSPYADNGYWVWSDYGWYWNSGYTWGWAPFHYGRWVLAPRRGWVWVPDRHWGPAWVSWRVGVAAVGWAPLPTAAAWSPARGFTHYQRPVGLGYDFGVGFGAYTYVAWTHFTSPAPALHKLTRYQAAYIHEQSHVVNDLRPGNGAPINHGPGLLTVQQRSHTEVQRVTLARATTPQVATAGGVRPTATGAILPVYQPSMRPAVPARVPTVGRPAASSANGVVMHPIPRETRPAPTRPYIGVTSGAGVRPAARPEVAAEPGEFAATRPPTQRPPANAQPLPRTPELEVARNTRQPIAGYAQRPVRYNNQTGAEEPQGPTIRYQQYPGNEAQAQQPQPQQRVAYEAPRQPVYERPQAPYNPPPAYNPPPQPHYAPAPAPAPSGGGGGGHSGGQNGRGNGR